jgi:hypothetical protein
MKEILLIALGWLLGIFGPPLTELIQNRRRRSQIRKSLFIEFRELKYQLAMSAFMLASNNGAVDKNLLEWVAPIIRSAQGRKDILYMEEALKPLLKLSDGELQAVSVLSKGKWESFYFGKYSLPFLSSQIASLYLFTPEFQRLALDINAKVHLLNEKIDFYRINHEKTFDSSISNNSLTAVHLNLTNTCKYIENLSRQTSDEIDVILQRRK